VYTRTTRHRRWRKSTITSGRRLAVLFALITACATGGVRPRYGALPDAVVITRIIRSPTLVIGDLEAAIRRAGLSVARYAPGEGFLETRWFDVASRAVAGAPYTHLDQTIRLRFFADPDQGKTRLVGEAVGMIAWDPSLPERDLERMLPAAHPGRVLLDSMLSEFRPDTSAAGRRRPPLDSL